MKEEVIMLYKSWSKYGAANYYVNKFDSLIFAFDELYEEYFNDYYEDIFEEMADEQERDIDDVRDEVLKEMDVMIPDGFGIEHLSKYYLNINDSILEVLYAGYSKNLEDFLEFLYNDFCLCDADYNKLKLKIGDNSSLAEKEMLDYAEKNAKDCSC